MKKLNLHKGRIYRKDGVWVVQYKTTERVRGGSPKQLGSYKLQPKVNYVPIRKEDIHNLKDPYDQGKETCFELILINEPRNEFQEVRFVADTKPVWYAKLWSTSEMVQDLQHYFETTPQEKIDEDWKKVEELDLVGPTVEEFLNQNSVKELYLLRGLPGSGKSSLAKSLIGDNDRCHREADMYFLDENGSYVFNPSQLKEAHAWCQEEIEFAMKIQHDRVVVSNTFTQEWEMQPYYDLAEKYGYRVYSLIVENRHQGINSHGVPEEKLLQMKQRFEIEL